MAWSRMLRQQERAASRARRQELVEARRASDLAYEPTAAEIGPPQRPDELIAEADLVLARERRVAVWKGPAIAALGWALAAGTFAVPGHGPPSAGLAIVMIVAWILAVGAWSTAITTGLGVLRHRGQLFEADAEDNPVWRIHGSAVGAIAGGAGGWVFLVGLIAWLIASG